LGNIFDNQILWTTIYVWLITQAIKVFLGVIREKRFNFKWLTSTGGMPSSHAAGVSALATSCGMQMGFDSPLFGLAAVFALVTMFDAQGVRRSSGQQAVILNDILDSIWKGKTKSSHIREFLGHTPLEVITGAGLGFLMAVIFYTTPVQ